MATADRLLKVSFIYVYFSISKQETELYLINYSINGEDHKSPVKGCMNVTHSKRRLDSN